MLRSIWRTRKSMLGNKDQLLYTTAFNLDLSVASRKRGVQQSQRCQLKDGHVNAFLFSAGARPFDAQMHKYERRTERKEGNR